MEITSAWTPITPEMEVKVMFGRHIWEFAQHADALGKRTFELRQPEQYTLTPAEPYRALLDEIALTQGTAARLAGAYDVVLPGLVARYRDYLQQTDSLLDNPSVVIIERILATHERQIADAASVRQQMSIERHGVDALVARETAVASIVAREISA